MERNKAENTISQRFAFATDQLVITGEMLPTLNEKDSTSETPVVVVQETKKASSTKKYIIIGVTSFLLLALLLTGILVGMHIFTREIVEYTLKLSGGRTQEVTSDVSSNVVKNHITDVDHEAWIVSDFNKDIKATKTSRKGVTNCYLAPLNKTNAMQPSEITVPDKTDNIEPKTHSSVVYQIAGDPITDISFLSKEARDMCKGVSTYWMYPSCNNRPKSDNSTARRKRDAPYWVYYTKNVNGVDYPCVNGCCKTVCACQIDYTWEVYSDETIDCTWISQRCCPNTNYCYYEEYCETTQYLECSSGSC